MCTANLWARVSAFVVGRRCSDAVVDDAGRGVEDDDVSGVGAAAWFDRAGGGSDREDVELEVLVVVVRVGDSR